MKVEGWMSFSSFILHPSAFLTCSSELSFVHCNVSLLTFDKFWASPMELNSIVLNLVVLAVNLLMMVSVGLSLEARHFIALSRLKASVIGLLVLQSITLPLIGVLVVSLFSLPPATKTGVLLL